MNGDVHVNCKFDFGRDRNRDFDSERDLIQGRNTGDLQAPHEKNGKERFNIAATDDQSSAFCVAVTARWAAYSMCIAFKRASR
jgi:hypothetical protein